jgi:hypothetical protein
MRCSSGVPWLARDLDALTIKRHGRIAGQPLEPEAGLWFLDEIDQRLVPLFNAGQSGGRRRG